MNEGPPDPPAPRWSIERRLDFIGVRLAWEGRINRLDLVARFGVSPNQATADLKRFAELHPNAMAYDTRAKTYRATAAPDQPRAADAGSVLRELRLIAEGVLPAEESVLAWPPSAEIAEPPVRTASAEILWVVLAAIRERRALSADYQSFSTPNPRHRLIEPHALVYDGFRWHVRARDAEEDRFKDFVLGRLSDATLGDGAKSTAADDVEWTTRVELEIRPHPKLATHQRNAIAVDYGMTDGRLLLHPRLAVAWYVKRRLGLVEGHDTRAPSDQHIVLAGERALPASPL